MWTRWFDLTVLSFGSGRLELSPPQALAHAESKHAGPWEQRRAAQFYIKRQQLLNEQDALENLFSRNDSRVLGRAPGLCPHSCRKCSLNCRRVTLTQGRSLSRQRPSCPLAFMETPAPCAFSSRCPWPPHQSLHVNAESSPKESRTPEPLPKILSPSKARWFAHCSGRSMPEPCRDWKGSSEAGAQCPAALGARSEAAFADKVIYAAHQSVRKLSQVHTKSATVHFWAPVRDKAPYFILQGVALRLTG